MLGEKLKEVREKSGLTQVDFAKRIEISPTTYSAYETGRQTARVDVIAKICKEFKVSSDWLLDLTNMVCRGCGEVYEPEKYSYKLKFCSRCGGELCQQDGHHQQA